MRASRRLHEDGFTLIEVLVALAIVAIGMAALLSALSSSADSASYLRDKTFAEWVALNRIEEVRLASAIPGEGKTDGEVELANRKWKWQQEVMKSELEGIMRVDVRVKPAEQSGDSNWLAEVSGIRGNTLSNPSGIIDYYAAQPRNNGNPPGGGNNGVPGGRTPGAANTPIGDPNAPPTPNVGAENPTPPSTPLSPE
jgi:general secretion pathway protein I